MARCKKILLIFLSSLLFMSCTKTGIRNVTYDSDSQRFSCEFRGRTRRFILCLPAENPASLVFMLHGYGGDGVFFKSETGFDKEACPQGYGVVYVNGIVNPDVSGSASGWLYGDGKNARDDIDFLEALAKYLQQEYGFDSKRTFAVGFSNGAFMCTKLATQKSKTFRAVVSVGGMMPENVWKSRDLSGKKKAGFFQINGTKDDVTPMKWNGSSKHNPNPAMEEVIGYFAGQWREGEVEIPGKTKGEDEKHQLLSPYEICPLSQRSTLYKYAPDVWWLLVQNGTHGWPTERWSGIRINEVILEFLGEF